MRIMVVGASKGLGRAFVEGLGQDAALIVGVARRAPQDVAVAPGCELRWIEADLSRPEAAVEQIAAQAPDELDAILYNLGVWEEHAFSEHYDFLADSPKEIARMVDINVTATILLLQRLIPRVLGARKPQVILTGSTSGLAGSGRPEVTFGASKYALRGIADALRESFRARRLAVTCLQLGYLNTQDGMDLPRDEASQRGEGGLIPVHDVVAMTRALLNLSDASFVRELVMPALMDERF
ncbi:SDR family oxidoreductase [Achromobacter xylosoxidans]|uniref:SDR family oxidoreductase n=1 Tax=Alcaligenes xylosoxydans xylosoxydans TaxID=85698 RepID=UPI000B4922F8|nr:SDR family oxidoreductase [Achromobacter xylosoxidans]